MSIRTNSIVAKIYDGHLLMTGEVVGQRPTFAFVSSRAVYRLKLPPDKMIQYLREDIRKSFPRDPNCKFLEHRNNKMIAQFIAKDCYLYQMLFRVPGYHGNPGNIVSVMAQTEGKISMEANVSVRLLQTLIMKNEEIMNFFRNI